MKLRRLLLLLVVLSVVGCRSESEMLSSADGEEEAPPVIDISGIDVLEGAVTEIETYVPTIPAGVPLEIEKGLECGARSLVLDRDGAWRCSKGNEIFELCFEVLGENVVLCDGRPHDYTSGRWFELEAEDLPNIVTKAGLKPEPWYVQLIDGRECRRARMHEVVAYACDDGGELDVSIDDVRLDWRAIDVATGTSVEISKAWVY